MKSSWPVLLLLICSCVQQTRSIERLKDPESSTIYVSPKTVELNLDGSYAVNQITGDTSQPIINALGDTIRTGIAIPIKGKLIDPDRVAKPKTVASGKPKIVPRHLNVHKVPENGTRIPINIDSLKPFFPKSDTASFVLINFIGDTIPTGVPIPVKGKVVPTLQPEAVMALTPQMKDKASSNIKYLDVEQGMTSTDIVTIFEDSKGNLSFGTEWGGVCMYDGHSFTHYSKNQGFKVENMVIKLT